MKRFERDEHKQKELEKRASRRADRKIVYEVHDLGNVPFPDGVLVRPLTTGEVERCYKPGFVGATGQLSSLLIGQELADVVDSEVNRSYFYQKNRLDLLLQDLEVDVTASPIADREAGFKAKVGPFYLKHYKSWANKAFASFTDNTTSVDFAKPALLRAVDKVKEQYRQLGGGHRLVTPSTLVDRLNKDASTGYPFFISDWDSPLTYEGEEISPVNWATRLADECFNSQDYSALDGMFYNMFTRTNYRGLDPRNQKSNERPVQCPPVLERLLGLPVQQHLVAIQKKVDFSRGLCGKDEMAVYVTEAMNRYDGCFEADYSAFDTSIGPKALSIVCEVIKATLHPDDHHLVDGLFAFYSTAELLTPTGLLSGTPSLMSGSMLTNVVGMVWGNIAWAFFIERLEEEGINLSHRAFGYSDDLAIFYDTSSCERPDLLFPSIIGELGLVAHKDKQFVSSGEERNIGFLGHIYSNVVRKGGLVLPIYPYYRGMSKLIWRERTCREMWDYSCIYDASGLTKLEQEAAKIMQRIDNFSTNPCFDDIADRIIRSSGVTKAVCANFRSKTAAFEALDAFELDNGPASDMVLPSPIEPLTEEEIELMLSLYRECVEHGGEVARRASVEMRDTLKKLKKVHKEKLKIAKKVDTVEKRVSTIGAPKYPQCQLVDRPLDWESRTYDSEGNPVSNKGTASVVNLSDDELTAFVSLVPNSPKDVRKLIERLLELRNDAEEDSIMRVEEVLLGEAVATVLQ